MLARLGWFTTKCKDESEGCSGEVASARFLLLVWTYQLWSGRQCLKTRVCSNRIPNRIDFNRAIGGDLTRRNGEQAPKQINCLGRRPSMRLNRSEIEQEVGADESTGRSASLISYLTSRGYFGTALFARRVPVRAGWGVSNKTR